VDRPPV
jgi:hypothetical protein